MISAARLRLASCQVVTKTFSLEVHSAAPYTLVSSEVAAFRRKYAKL